MASLAPVAAAEPRWGSPVQQPKVAFDELLELGRGVDGAAILVRGKVPVPERVSSPPGVARNERGDAFVMWTVDGFAVSQYVPAGGTVERKLQDIESEGSLPAVSMNRTGDVVAAWNGKGTTMVVATRIAGTWSAPQVLSTPDRTVPERAVALLDDGTAVAVWIEATSTATAVVASGRDPATGAWSPVRVLDVKSGPLSNVQVALDSAGRGLAVWITGDGREPGELRFAELAGAGVWGPPVSLGSVVEAPAISMSPAGNAAIAWVPDGSDREVLAVVTRPVGGSWTAPERLAAGGIVIFAPEIDVSDTGHVALAWSRLPDSGELSPVPRARVKVAGGGWLRPQDLGGPAEDEFFTLRIITDVAIGNDGRALALDATLAFFGDPAFRLSEFAESAPRTPPTPVTIKSVAADDVTTGSLQWVRARLSRAVENGRLVLQRKRGSRWVDVAGRSVSGRTVAIAVRETGAGRRTFRLRLRAAGGATLSRPVTVVAQRPTQRTVPVGRDPLDMDAGGGVLWVLSSNGARRSLHRIDGATGRRGGRVLPGGADTFAVAAASGVAWVTDGRTITSINARTGRRGAPLKLSRDPRVFISDIASDGTSVWAALVRFQGFAATQDQLVRVNRQGRVLSRIKVPSVASGGNVGELQVGGGSVWLTFEEFFGNGSTLRLDLRTGRFADVSGSVAVGRDTVWGLGDPVHRIVPEGGPSRRPPLERVRDDEDLPISGLYTPVVMTPASVGPDAVWALTGSEARLAVRRIDPRTAAVSEPIPVGPPIPSLPFTAVSSSAQLVAVAGGAWVMIPELGTLVRVTRR